MKGYGTKFEEEFCGWLQTIRLTYHPRKDSGGSIFYDDAERITDKAVELFERYIMKGTG